MLGLLTMINLYFVELWKGLVPESEIVRGPETSNEQIIHSVYISTVIIFSVIFWGIILAMIIYYNMMNNKLRSRQVQLLEQLDSMERMSYDQVKRDKVTGDANECAICFE